MDNLEIKFSRHGDLDICTSCNTVTFDEYIKKCQNYENCEAKYCDSCDWEFLHDNWCASCAKTREDIKVSSNIELFKFALEKLNLTYEQLKEMHAEKKYQSHQPLEHSCYTCETCSSCCDCCDECVKIRIEK